MNFNLYSDHYQRSRDPRFRRARRHEDSVGPRRRQLRRRSLRGTHQHRRRQTAFENNSGSNNIVTLRHSNCI